LDLNLNPTFGGWQLFTHIRKAPDREIMCTVFEPM